jgi:glutathione peroxidase
LRKPLLEPGEADKLHGTNGFYGVQRMAYLTTSRLRTTTALWLLVVSGLSTGLQAAPNAADATNPAATPSATCPALLSRSFNRLQDEAPQNLCQYAGKAILVVNTASFCGFTNQYEGLEALYGQYKSKGLVVLGFPSNDFGKQEPGSDKEIADFCTNTYAVKFPMFSKSTVVGSGRNPLYMDLAKATGQFPQWNFHKYLIDRSGKVVQSFDSNVKPQSKQLVSAIEKVL